MELYVYLSDNKEEIVVEIAEYYQYEVGHRYKIFNIKRGSKLTYDLLQKQTGYDMNFLYRMDKFLHDTNSTDEIDIHDLSYALSGLYEKRKTIIVSAFPGCGKSKFHKYNKDYITLDSDSSNYSWIKDEFGINTDIRNPDFPNNYISHIKENIGKVDIIFVSSHANVRNALIENKLNYILIYPHKELRKIYLDNYYGRGNNSNFIEFMSINYCKFVDDIEADTNKYVTKIRLDENYKYIDEGLISSLL